MAIKSVVALLVGLTLAAVHLAEAQQPKKVPRIGYLSAYDAATDSVRAEAIRRALRELGYLEGRTSLSSTDMRTGSVDRYS